MKVGISACSDGQLKEWEKQNEELETILYEQGIEATFAKHIYANPLRCRARSSKGNRKDWWNYARRFANTGEKYSAN